MGYSEMDWVWEHSEASKTDKLVLLAIARRYRVGVGAWPSQDYLAKQCGVNVRSVRSSIVRLEALGELVWKSGSKKSGKANCYVLPKLEFAKTSALDAKTSAKSAKTSAENDKNFLPLNKQLNKLNKREVNSFVWASGEPLVLETLDRFGDVFSVFQLEAFFREFQGSKYCRDAYTDSIRVARWFDFLARKRGF